MTWVIIDPNDSMTRSSTGDYKSHHTTVCHGPRVVNSNCSECVSLIYPLCTCLQVRLSRAPYSEFYPDPPHSLPSLKFILHDFCSLFCRAHPFPWFEVCHAIQFYLLAVLGRLYHLYFTDYCRFTNSINKK